MILMLRYFWLGLVSVAAIGSAHAQTALDALHKITKGDNPQKLPSGSIAEEVLPNAILLILGLFGIVLTGVIIYAGVLYVTSYGEEEAQTSARQLLFNGIYGIFIVASAYGAVYALLNFDLSL